MSFISAARSFPQKATHWAQQGQLGFGGESWAFPVIIKCRWEDLTDEALSVAYKVSGEIIVSNSLVYTPTPLKQGDYIMLGESVVEIPSTLTGRAFIIRQVMTIPSLDGSWAEYTAKL